MERIVLILGFSTSWLLFAADEPGSNGGSWVNFDWQNMTALGVLALVLGFIVMKMLPDLHAKFIDQAKVFASTAESIQNRFAETLDKMHARAEGRNEQRHEDQQAMATALKELTAQCARRQTQGPNG